MMRFRHVGKLAIEGKEREDDPQSVSIERFLVSAGTGRRKSFQGTGLRVPFEAGSKTDRAIFGTGL